MNILSSSQPIMEGVEHINYLEKLPNVRKANRESSQAKTQNLCSLPHTQREENRDHPIKTNPTTTQLQSRKKKVISTYKLGRCDGIGTRNVIQEKKGPKSEANVSG